MVSARFISIVSLLFTLSARADRCALDAVFGGPQVAENAGLHYLESYPDGITRTEIKGQWVYRGPNGKAITDADELSRIESLQIPKVYHDVWISNDPLSHIQAIAKDEKGRTQYRYHPLWKDAKKKIKFARMIEFGDALPKIHEQEANDLASHGLPKNKVLAAVAIIMEKTGIRVGSQEYALENETYGLTTFLKDHAKVDGDKVTFHFIGKASKEHEIDFIDPKIAELVKNLNKTPDKSLFQFQDQTGAYHAVNANMLNNYLAEAADGHFTAKDFRTWMGTMTAAKTLLEKPTPTTDAAIKKDILDAIDSAADRLGNTRSVARDNYIEPTILSTYQDAPKIFAMAKAKALKPSNDGKTPEERLVMFLLK